MNFTSRDNKGLVSKQKGEVVRLWGNNGIRAHGTVMTGSFLRLRLTQDGLCQS